MRKADTPSGRRLVVAMLAAPLLLGGCWDLTRFKQERYECGYNPQGLVELMFRESNLGNEAEVTFTDETLSLPIIESTDSAFTLAKDGLIIRINRDTGTIRMTRGSRYRNVKCTKSEFRM